MFSFLNLLKNIKIKYYLIFGLTFLIIVFSLIFLLSKKNNPSAPLNSPLPTPLPSSLNNPYSNLPLLPSNYPTPDKQLQNQPIDNPLIGKEIEDFYSQNPWLKQLPIVNKAYIAVYDWKKKAIRIRIIINPNSPLSREEQIKKVKTIAPQKLKEIGVDLNKQKIYYTFIP